MTIVVSVRVHDGIVLASDSASTMVDTGTGHLVKVYNHADKIFNLVKGLPIGAMTFGNGSIGTASISTLSKDLRRIFTPTDARHPDELDRDNYTIHDVALRCQDFFAAQLAQNFPNGLNNFSMGYRVCGYSSNSPLSEAWEIKITDKGVTGPEDLYPNNGFGPRWQGEGEALDRLILGVGANFPGVLHTLGIPAAVAETVYMQVVSNLRTDLYIPAMPIQDAIDLARFLAETAVKFVHFRKGAPTVGGHVELATITKHEGYRWVSRKHYFTTALNGGL